MIETPSKIFPEYYLIKVTKFQEKVKNKLDEWINHIESLGKECKEENSKREKYCVWLSTESES